MIQTLTIKNFQSHRDSHLEFVPGLNVIVGSTDSGKTSIIRALRWLVWNRPGGEAFRSDWGGDTRVEVEVEDTIEKSLSHLIARFKSKEITNGYSINTKVLNAFGTGVPPIIQKELNITEVNLQMQLDAHFLLSKSPGEVAAYFNKVAHLEKIDTATRYIMSGLRDLERSQKQDVAEIETLEEEFTTYDYLDKVEAELEVLEDLEKNWLTKHQNKGSLESTIYKIEKIEEEKEKHAGTLSLKKPVEELLELHEKKEGVWQVLDALQETRAEIGKAESDIEFLTKQSAVLPDVRYLLGLYILKKEKQEEEETLSNLFLEINSLELQIVDVREDLESAETEFHENLGEICPLCGNETN